MNALPKAKRVADEQCQIGQRRIEMHIVQVGQFREKMLIAQVPIGHPSKPLVIAPKLYTGFVGLAKNKRISVSVAIEQIEHCLC